MKIPFILVPESKVKAVMIHYMGWGETLSRFFPFVQWELEQANFPYNAREWLSVAFHGFLIYFSIVFSLMFVIMMRFQMNLLSVFVFSGLIGFGAGFAVLIYLVFYPKFFVNKKIKDVDKHLSVALHHMLIEVRAGVPLFNTMVSVARSNYGHLSEEFSKAVNEINTGKSEISALEKIARENSSLYFRRILWQIINSLKSGSDIGGTLKEIVNHIGEEQRIAIKRYGSELNPLALFYMLLVVIFPTLGIIFILILFSFLGAIFNIEFILIGILMFLVIFNFMFMGLIKAKRSIGM